MELKYQKASEQRVIFGWKNISSSSISHLYNTSDVVSYSRKLDYVRNLLVRNNFPIWMKIILGFSLATCLSTIARADDASTTPTEKELYDECSEFSMAGIHDCLRKKRDESQKVLAQAEARMNTVMSRWDVDDQFIATAKSNFIKDKQEFLKYREVHCNFMRSLGGPVIGIGLDARLYTCVAELNYRRAKLLEDVFPDLPSK